MENRDKIKSLKQISNSLKPEFNLGKAGITSTFLKSVNEYLDVHNIVKIKALIAEDKSSVEYLAGEVVKETNSILVDKRGFTFTIYRK